MELTVYRWTVYTYFDFREGNEDVSAPHINLTNLLVIEWLKKN